MAIANSATVGGGCCNIASGNSSTVGGGCCNRALGNYSNVGGGGGNRTLNIFSTVGGGGGNCAIGACSTIAGGATNFALADLATIGGGSNNCATGVHSTIGGGSSNRAFGNFATVGGGSSNQATGILSTIGGGFNNFAAATYANVGGGCFNKATGISSTIGGGGDNTASGSFSTVGGGRSNRALGDYSYIIGGRCSIIADSHSGSAVLGDGQNRAHNSSSPHSLTLDFDSGVYFAKPDIYNSVNFRNSGIFSLSGAVAAGLPNNPLSVVGSGNTYLQLNIQNRATGLLASADLVITANNGTDSSNFINLGINNSGYNDPTYTNGTGLDGYLFINGGNLDIGTQTPNTAIEFHAGGTTLGSTIARISQSGLNIVSGNLTVGGTGVLLSGQNIFVLQGGTTQSNTSVGDNYIGLAGANIGWSNTSASRRVAILENCVARKASITLQQEAAGNAVSNITGSIVNFTQNLTGIISTTIASNNNNNFINFSNSNLNLPFSAGDNVGVLIHSQLVITGLRGMANVYFYN